MKRNLAIFLAVFFAIVASECKADLLYSTNFDSPLYSNGALIGQDGWAITGTTTTNAIAVSNGSVALTTSGQDVNRLFTPVTALTADSITLQADITVTAAQGTTGDYFLHLGDNLASNFYSRIYARSGTGAGTFQLAMGTSSGTPVTYGADLTLGQTFTILAQYNFVSGTGNDTGSLSVDGSAYIAATTIGTDATSISSVRLRQGSAATSPTLTIDNISVNSITAVPEPSSIALLALCGTAGVIYRRRRIAKY